MSKLTIEQLSQVKGPILLTGETGVGKSRMAKKIHQSSPRKNAPFVKVNLGALPEDLIESQLYGHSRGSFTGAVTHQRGLCELAGAGTLFLDEIGELSLTGQKKLLHLLDDGQYLAVGSEKEKQFLGQIIAATNQDLKEAVAKQQFREDLFYRLQVFSYEIPPLRKRPEEIRELITYFFNDFLKDFPQKQLRIDPYFFEQLVDLPWPGNIREVKNCLQYMVNLAPGPTLTQSDLPHWISLSGHIRHSSLKDDKERCDSVARPIEEVEYYSAKARFEKKYLEKVLGSNQGRINKTARVIGLNKSTLISKIKKYQIKVQQFKT